MNYYDTIAQGYDELHKEEQLKKLRLVLERFVDLPSGDVLDVGCGTGFSLDIVAATIGRKCQGIDPSSGLLAHYKGEQELQQGCAEALPFADATFAGIISLTAVQNFDSVPQGLEEMRRVAKKEGKIIVTCLKKSAKLKEVSEVLADLFSVIDIIEEEKDLIFVCRKE